MIAVCLLTCGREDLTLETCETFTRHNDGRGDLRLLHCDAGGPDWGAENCAIARENNFETIMQPSIRVGQMASFRRFFATIEADRSIEFMLWLENDWASSHPIPNVAWFRQFPKVQTWRLYGATKMRTKGPRFLTGTKRLGTDEMIGWKPARVKGWEETKYAHWAAGGTIVRPHALRPYLACERLKDVILAANDLRSMRPTKNILWHIGLETTEGFMG